MNRKVKLGLLATPVILATGSVATYFLIERTKTKTDKNSNNDVSKKTHIDNTNQNKNIFPKITFDEIYDEIILVKNAPIISDDMIAKFIKIVFMRIGTSTGKIKVEIAYRDRGNVEIKFTWLVDSKIRETKIYKMKLRI